MELKRPIPTEGVLQSVGKVVDIADKKSGALVVVNGEDPVQYCVAGKIGVDLKFGDWQIW